MKKIAVVGAGVNGLSVACKLAEKFYHDAQITLFSDETTPNTTGDGSAGLWGPYLLGSTPNEKIVQWSKLTHDFFQNLWTAGLAQECGISLLPCIRLTTSQSGFEDPAWKNVVFGYTKLTEEQLNRYRNQSGKNYTGGVQYLTFTAEPVALLPYLFKRFEKAGGVFERRKVFKIDDLAKEHYDLVINCTGINAKELVNDNEVLPIRGQVARVKAPWAYTCVQDDDHYVIPNQESVVLGGTHQENDFNRNPDPKDTEFILVGCSKLFPALNNAPVLREWVGLRPGRSSVRLELDHYRTNTGRNLLVIHNYGHGGAGVTLGWGCAYDVVILVQKNLDLTPKDKTESKL